MPRAGELTPRLETIMYMYTRISLTSPQAIYPLLHASNYSKWWNKNMGSKVITHNNLAYTHAIYTTHSALKRQSNTSFTIYTHVRIVPSSLVLSGSWRCQCLPAWACCRRRGTLPLAREETWPLWWLVPPSPSPSELAWSSWGQRKGEEMHTHTHTYTHTHTTHEAGGFLATAAPTEGSSSSIVLREWVSSNSCHRGKWPKEGSI